MSEGQRTVVTIDGFSGSGKSTLAARLAERLGFAHFNSGLLYRAAGLLAMERGSNLDDEHSVMGELTRHTISMDFNEGRPQLKIDVAFFQDDGRLQSPEVSEAASKVSRHPVVREYLKQQQRHVFAGRPLVAEGRDMGTVIFPDANLKFFVECNEEIRCERRLAQFLGSNASPEERQRLKNLLKIEILERDQRDRERAISPTIPAKDAIIIDNSGPSLTHLVDTMYDFATQRGLVPKLV